MTAEPPGAEAADVGSRLDALDGDATAEHLAVYTAIAGALAARLDEPAEQPKSHPNPAPHPGRPAGIGEHGGARG